MATIYEIVQGLSQAAANGYDGALDENGEPVKIGLKREDGDPILDQRVMVMLLALSLIQSSV
jgi:hypothetical protein